MRGFAMAGLAGQILMSRDTIFPPALRQPNSMISA
jgi:hypothetical protein